MGRSLLRPGVFAFNCRPFVIIATDSRPPCCISRFLPRRAPSLLQPPFVPPFPTLPFSIPFSPFSQPSLSLSLALSLSLFLSVSLSPSYLTLSSHLPSIFLCPFSDATTFRSRSPVLVCLPSSTSTQTLSRASIYEYTMNVPLARLYRGPPPVQRISSFCAVSGSLSDTTVVSPTRVLFVSPSWTQTGRERERQGKRQGKGKKERSLRVHVSTDTRPKSPRWKSLPSSSHSQARVTWPLQWRN